MQKETMMKGKSLSALFPSVCLFLSAYHGDLAELITLCKLCHLIGDLVSRPVFVFSLGAVCASLIGCLFGLAHLGLI